MHFQFPGIAIVHWYYKTPIYECGGEPLVFWVNYVNLSGAFVVLDGQYSCIWFLIRLAKTT